jgi:methanethiol S-methyltransferase
MVQPTTYPSTRISRSVGIAYGLAAYLLFLAVFTYALGFLANVGVPKGIDDGPAGPPAAAVLVNAGLMGLFAVQHSVMARPWFKRRLMHIVPPAIERSTYVLGASLVVALLLWQWRPLPATVWSVDVGWAAVMLWLLKVFGVVIVVGSTFAAGHFKMFGVRQAFTRAARHHDQAVFRRPRLFWLVRHPIMVGFLIAFWASPHMSVGRLLFNLFVTGYILVAVRFQERDLRIHFGEAYEEYARRVPRFVPRLARVSHG